MNTVNDKDRDLAAQFAGRGPVEAPTQNSEKDGPVVLPLIDLRDHFAGLAMQGELSAFQSEELSGLPLDIPSENLGRLAAHWYRIADAMLKARSA